MLQSIRLFLLFGLHFATFNSQTCCASSQNLTTSLLVLQIVSSVVSYSQVLSFVVSYTQIVSFFMSYYQVVSSVMSYNLAL